MSTHRIAVVALCVGAGVTLAAASPAAAGPSVTVQLINQTGAALTLDPHGTTLDGTWADPPGAPSILPVGTTQAPSTNEAVPVPDPDGGFYADLNYLYAGVNFYAGFDLAAGGVTASCAVDTESRFTCTSVDGDAFSQPPPGVTFLPESSDEVRPGVRMLRVVRRSLTEEAVRRVGLGVVVRSNEPARARAELISKDGDRHALARRSLAWGGRAYRLRLRLSRAGRRALDEGDVYKLRVHVTDRARNRRTVQRRVVIR
jgi:hypothetical protein